MKLKKIISIILISSMILSTNGFYTLADSIDEVMEQSTINQEQQEDEFILTVEDKDTSTFSELNDNEEDENLEEDLEKIYEEEPEEDEDEEEQISTSSEIEDEEEILIEDEPEEDVANTVSTKSEVEDIDIENIENEDDEIISTISEIINDEEEEIIEIATDLNADINLDLLSINKKESLLLGSSPVPLFGDGEETPVNPGPANYLFTNNWLRNSTASIAQERDSITEIIFLENSYGELEEGDYDERWIVPYSKGLIGYTKGTKIYLFDPASKNMIRGLYTDPTTKKTYLFEYDNTKLDYGAMIVNETRNINGTNFTFNEKGELVSSVPVK